jgi:hypothetical protein
MPNICDNHLTVTGAAKEQAEFIAKAFAEENFPNAFVPEPDWASTPNENGELPTKDGEGNLCFSDGAADQRWYDWRNEHWGDKWAAQLTDTPETSINQDDDSVIVSFQTAWGPYEEGVWGAVSAFAPEAEIDVRYDERNNDFYGVTVAKGGKCLCENHSISDLMDEVAESEVGREQRKQFTEDVDPEDEDAMGEAVEEWWSEYGAGHIDEAQESLAIELLAQLQIK